MLMDLAAMLSPQNRRLFKFKNLANPEQQLLLESFKGTEGLSRAYNFELLLVCQDSDVELKSMMGQHVVLEIELADATPRYLAGYLTRFASIGSDGGMARYTATLNPWFSMLKNRFDTRIFQGCTVEDVVTQVFALCTAFSRHEFRLSKPLKHYTYITQYRESDFNFVQRLLEEEGMFYYFEHTAEGHTMIICDDSSMLVPLPEQPQIRFHTASVTETADSITQWSGNRQLQSGKIAVQTFDYRQPSNRLPVAMKSLNKQGDVDEFEIYDFPGQYTHGTYDEGETLLRLRVEALELKGKSFHGASNCRAMKPGFTFELLQHLRLRAQKDRLPPSTYHPAPDHLRPANRDHRRPTGGGNLHRRTRPREGAVSLGPQGRAQRQEFVLGPRRPGRRQRRFRQHPDSPCRR
jgi:type VI secretion system secreted protein VgrG